ncbi:nucleotidyl transferase AbiEii/AbiGii toxin family protein [Rariglobus hedericola]|uniref:Nucleotidyl transferase AbiEii/AbiGii toxin family protein n=1 Tax=Rariglobus hedericola TaxID=2597822 RepID=A0A556QQR1_9BACT|nr:nucleotidyl transferase AbiEii/AbiGii toxin family protein [Rariglobus hedericola]TSJ78976.1 nucleotidyl transferase AbiEii/AbiGii toxin family protein [Rariglobus hedericola]
MGPYTEILKALTDARVDFIVGGGVACVLHGVERVTMDIDLSVHMVPDNLREFIDVMATLGLKPRVPIAPSALLEPAFIRMMIEDKHALVFSFLDPDRPVRHVDIFLKADLGYESLLPDSQWVDVDGMAVRIINRPRLLAIKLAIIPARAKDALDIEFLSRHEN